MMRVQRQKITGIVHECSIHFTNLSTRFFLFCFEKTNGHNVNCLVFIPDFLLEWMYSREFFLWPFSPRSILFTYQFSLVRFHDMLMADVIPVKTLIIYIYLRACVCACVSEWVLVFSNMCNLYPPLHPCSSRHQWFAKRVDVRIRQLCIGKRWTNQSYT